MANLSNFVERLKEFMILNNLNATKLSEITDIDRSSISALLRGEHYPATKTLFAFLEIFKCSADYLLGLTDDYIEEKTYLTPTDNFGERFRFLLDKTGTTQYALTKYKNISGNLLYKWLHNQALPTVFNLIKLSEYMEISVDCLIGRED